MAEDMEMFLEEVIKKTNPQEYIKILEQDREDFAEEIERLNNIIDELEDLITIKISRASNEEDYDIEIDDMIELKDKLNELKGDNK